MNHYARCIDILGKDLSHAELVAMMREIAKASPSLVARAYTATQPKNPPKEIDEKILALCAGDQYIQAIKMYREHSGAGLKHAKDYVDAVRENARNKT